MNSVHQNRLKNVFVVHWVIFFLSGCISIYIYFFFSMYFWPHWVFIAVHRLSLIVDGGLLVAVSSLIAEHELHGVRSSQLSHCGTQP